MRLSPYLRPDLVTVDLRRGGIDQFFDSIAERLREKDIVGDPAPLVDALRSREASHTTVVGRGVAVPHATIEGISEPLVLVDVYREGIVFGPVGLDPVHVFIVLLSPPAMTGTHIKLLARIARLLRDPAFAARLREADSADEVVREITRVDAEHV